MSPTKNLNWFFGLQTSSRTQEPTLMAKSPDSDQTLLNPVKSLDFKLRRSLMAKLSATFSNFRVWILTESLAKRFYFNALFPNEYFFDTTTAHDDYGRKFESVFNVNFSLKTFHWKLFKTKHSVTRGQISEDDFRNSLSQSDSPRPFRIRKSFKPISGR